METTDPKYTAGDVDVASPDTTPHATPDAHPLCGRLALLSLAVAIVAWLCLMLQGYVALFVGILAVVLGVAGLRSSRPLRRNCAITAIIAAGVLLVVLSAFLFVILWGINSI